MNSDKVEQLHPSRRVAVIIGLVLIGLVVALAGGAALRLTGVNWDENQHLHPDERFLSQVQTAIAPVENPGDYFNTATSSLNPANRGHTFFVYGTLPIFIIRYVGEALGKTDYHAITLVGRYVSAIFDIVTILIVFFIGQRLSNRWTGLLAAWFYALAVLPIQLSHYATVDAITNTFAYLAVLAAVWALTRGEKLSARADPIEPNQPEMKARSEGVKSVFLDLAPYILFGVALGAATASKINAVTLALILPLVELVRYWRADRSGSRESGWVILRNVAVAAGVSFIIFRVSQPYAFTGPGFFDFKIQPEWWAGLQSLRAQASGQVDFPPALQWARRPLTFSAENLIRWGLGIPLGLTALISFVVMGIRIIKNSLRDRLFPLWAFTGLYFLWQSLSWVRSMRYQMLIYPALTIIAGWGLVQLVSARKGYGRQPVRINPGWIRAIGLVLTAGVFTATAVWALAFTHIYTQPITRLAASRWIYQNLPGALTLTYETESDAVRQPLPYRAGDTVTRQNAYSHPFRLPEDGMVTSIQIPHILDQTGGSTEKVLRLAISRAGDPEQVLGEASIASAYQQIDSDWRGGRYDFFFDKPIAVEADDLYYLQLTLISGDTTLLMHGSPRLSWITDSGMSLISPLPLINQSVQPDAPYMMSVQALYTGRVSTVTVPYLVNLNPATEPGTLQLTLIDPAGERATGVLRSVFAPGADLRGQSYLFELEPPLDVSSGETLQVSLTTDSPGVRLVPHASAPVHESAWDDAIPYPVDGFSPYSESAGIYRGDLNFEMYWADNDLKLSMFETLLDAGDYLFITSSRQWGTTTRLPERYPLTTFYYRHLLGCPDEMDLEVCYGTAEPGLFAGDLGFELVATFESHPKLGSFEINDQASEEAFTVYDHPKVLIFKKTAAYDPLAVRGLLRSVDLESVIYFTPGEADNYQTSDRNAEDDPRRDLLLPEERLSQQRAHGTWADLFDRNSWINQSEIAAVAGLYLLVTILGWLSYPLVRLALPGLHDRGYPLSKLAGLLLLAFLVWILGSLGVPVTRTTIVSVLAVLVLLATIPIILQRKRLREELKNRWRYFLTVEALALGAFVFFLLVRRANPDLWHPYKGGEKPMDFSYLNAVLKSSTFPPYDPWFAGGYINYYYYGFVLVGMPIKLLGIIPAVAYNIVLPLWYSLLILSAFSVGWNLYQGIPRSRALRAGERTPRSGLGTAFWAGLATATGLAVLGNLGTIRLIVNGYQRLASGGALLDTATLAQRVSWTFQGFGQFLQGIPMPFYPGDWYWFPSRVIPGEAITEFPFFSFLYGDLHAHLIAFPITIFAVSWSLSVVLGKARWGEADGRLRLPGTVAGFLLGSLVIGALRPTNTWDFYTYLILACLALLYGWLRNQGHHYWQQGARSTLIKRLAVAAGGTFLLALLAIIFYQPFSAWYGQGFNTIKIWQGDRTPLSSYFTHWGLLLFVIISWMGWETYHWMKTTPQSALKQLQPHKNMIRVVIVSLVVVTAGLLFQGVVVALIVLPVGLWTVVLMLRPGQSDGRRFLLFLIGTGLTLTLVVELIYLAGDIGRMNTVFKFYLQAWILLSLAAGVCLIWTLQSLRYWRNKLSFIWQLGLFILVTSALLFTVMGTTDKIRDRMAPDAPRTLNGMAYMDYATYYDLGIEMQLSQDAAAIRWMQENVSGSPVIVEGQAYEYRWGNRMTIYTGLPGVIGWNWHQRQQRAILRNNIVQERVDAVGEFYRTLDKDYALSFLDRYDVDYIVVGQLERIFYPGWGLDKFEQFEGQYWHEVFRAGDTVIYQVLD